VDIRQEVVIVVRPVPETSGLHEPDESSTNPIGAVREAAQDAVASAVGLFSYTAQTAAKLAQDTATSAMNATLDVVVPKVSGAILSRLDLTQIVVDNVDVNKIAAAVNLEPIIDRVPITDIADYVIAEIDLPEVIRGSTGGIADQVMQAVRFKAISSDQSLARIVDRILVWRDGRSLKTEK
jgi:hypothetical protein